MSLKKTSSFLLDSLAKEKLVCSKEKAIKIASIMQDRVTFPKDFWEQGRFFFIAPLSFDEAVVAKKWNEDAVKVLSAFRKELHAFDNFDSASAKLTLEKVTAALGIATGKILQAARLAITGVGGGPDLMMIMEIIGKNEVIMRIDHALKTLQVKVA